MGLLPRGLQTQSGKVASKGYRVNRETAEQWRHLTPIQAEVDRLALHRPKTAMPGNKVGISPLQGTNMKEKPTR